MKNAWKKPLKINHQRERISSINKFHGKNANEVADMIRGTGSTLLKQKTWAELKKEVFNKYGYQCMCCGHIPKDKRNANVDHIKPRKYFPELALSFENLQVLCGRCNKAKSNKHATDYRGSIHPEVSSGAYSDYNIWQLLKQL